MADAISNAEPKRRPRSRDRGDAVADALRGCMSVDEFVDAARGVVSESEVRARYAEAPNFGQFRMVIANRMRCEIDRVRSERQRDGRRR